MVKMGKLSFFYISYLIPTGSTQFDMFIAHIKFTIMYQINSFLILN